MAAADMHGFFDQRHFARDCCCHSEENQDGERCPVHNLSALSSYEPADCANETKVLPVEINQSFPRQPTSESLSSLIEYRIKILAAAESMLMKPAENLPLRFLSEGLISPLFRGPLTVELQNSSGTNVHLGAGSLVAYMVLTPFIE